MEDLICAPVIIPTLNRAEHLVRCIESLKKCKHAEKTEVFISVDFPSLKRHEEGHNKIEEYLSGTFTEFKEMHVYYQEHNLGASLNLEFLVDQVSEQFDRYIIAEDDNEFSYNFLEYIDKGLMLFENDESILNICSMQGDGPWMNSEENAFYIQICPAYGLGCWKKKEEKLRKVDIDYFVAGIGKDYSKIKKIFSKSKMCYQQLVEGVLWKKNPIFFINDEIRWCDTMRSIYAISEDRYFIAPRVSKVRNWGFDGSGENMKKQDTDPYQMWSFDNESFFDYNLSYNGTLVDTYNQYIDRSGCRVSWKYIVIAMIKYFLYRVKGM